VRPGFPSTTPLSPPDRKPGLEFCGSAYLLCVTAETNGRRWLETGRASRLNAKECDMAKQLLLFANELRIRAEEIPARAATADDSQAEGMTRVLAAG